MMIRTIIAVATLCSLSAQIGSAKQLDKVTLGVNAVVSDAPFYIAQAKGMFKDQGLDVEFVSFDSGPKMVAPLGAGQLDVGAGAISAGLLNSQSRGLNIRIVADKGSTTPTVDHGPLIVRKDLVDSGKVKSYADLRGLKVAEAGKGGAVASRLNEFLKTAGLTYADVEHVWNMGYPQQVTALANGAVDAAISSEPSVTQAVEKGVAVRFSKPEDYPNQQIATLLYSDNFAKKRPDVAQRFMNAYLAAVRLYNDAVDKNGRFSGPVGDEVIDILATNTSVRDKNILRAMIANGNNPDGEVNVDSLEKDLSFFRSQGYIEGDPNLSSMIDMSFARNTVKKLGMYNDAGN